MAIVDGNKVLITRNSGVAMDEVAALLHLEPTNIGEGEDVTVIDLGEMCKMDDALNRDQCLVNLWAKYKPVYNNPNFQSPNQNFYDFKKTGKTSASTYWKSDGVWDNSLKVSCGFNLTNCISNSSSIGTFTNNSSSNNFLDKLYFNGLRWTRKAPNGSNNNRYRLLDWDGYYSEALSPIDFNSQLSSTGNLFIDTQGNVTISYTALQDDPTDDYTLKLSDIKIGNTALSNYYLGTLLIQLDSYGNTTNTYYVATASAPLGTLYDSVGNYQPGEGLQVTFSGLYNPNLNNTRYVYIPFYSSVAFASKEEASNYTGTFLSADAPKVTEANKTMRTVTFKTGSLTGTLTVMYHGSDDAESEDDIQCYIECSLVITNNTNSSQTFTPYIYWYRYYSEGGEKNLQSTLYDTEITLAAQSETTISLELGSEYLMSYMTMCEEYEEDYWLFEVSTRKMNVQNIITVRSVMFGKNDAYEMVKYDYDNDYWPAE